MYSQAQLRQELFSLPPKEESLGQKAARGGVAVMGSEIASALIRISSLAILARLLSPEDYGLVAMVTALTMFAERFKDMGLADATVQTRELSQPQMSNLFWFNLSVSCGIAVLLACLSPAISLFYHEGRLTAVTLAIATTFVFSGAVVQHQALLQRRLRFGSLSLVQVVSVAASQGIAIVSALMGAGYWSLVVREVVRAVAVMAGTWIALPWRPGLPNREGNIRRLLVFGRDVTGYNLVVFFSRNIDKILLGKLHGPRSVGLYSNAFSTVGLPVSQIQYPVNAVALPALSSLQTREEEFDGYYQEMVGLLSFLTMPIVVLVAVFADKAVRIVLGEQWMGATDIVRALALGILFEPVAQSVGPAMVSCGRTKEYFWIGLSTSIVLVVGLIVGSIWGAIGAAFGRSAAVLGGTLVSIRLGLRYTSVSVSRIVKKVSTTLAVALCAGGIVWGLRLLLGWEVSPLLNLALLLTGGTAYLGIWTCFRDGRRSIAGYIRFAVKALKRKLP